jgi:hypothetical protein
MISFLVCHSLAQCRIARLWFGVWHVYVKLFRATFSLHYADTPLTGLTLFPLAGFNPVINHFRT